MSVRRPRVVGHEDVLDPILTLKDLDQHGAVTQAPHIIEVVHKRQQAELQQLCTSTSAGRITTVLHINVSKEN